MNAVSGLPPGFGFHPTDEQLLSYYLPKRVSAQTIDLGLIKDVDLNKIEPWDLMELCNIGGDDEKEWYFFSHKGKKYPAGSRTNRATKAGFWKATGRDKAIYSKNGLVGMRKTLVFYNGRAPNGLKSDWIMHEYRLETCQKATAQDEGWVVCKVFKKRLPTSQKMGDYESLCCYNPSQESFMSKLDSSSQVSHLYSSSFSHLYSSSFYHQCPCNPELKWDTNFSPPSFLQFSQQNSPKLPYGFGRNNVCSLKSSTNEGKMDNQNNIQNLDSFHKRVVDQMTAWKTMDKYVASQLKND